MFIVPHAIAHKSRHSNKLATGAQTWLTHYLGRHVLKGSESPVTSGIAPPPEVEQQSGSLYPMAHLVEQEPKSEIPPHYHRPAQFQVFVAGDGNMGRHVLEPVAVHFAAPFSPYGPIRAGQCGLQYFTLRNGWDPGARWMPGARAELEAQRTRVGHALFAESLRPATPTKLRDLIQPTGQILVEAPHGLLVSVHRVPPRASWNSPDPALGAGQFQLVIGGSGMARDHAGASLEIGSLSCIFISPADGCNSIQANESGMEVVVMQFPQEAYLASKGSGRASS